MLVNSWEKTNILMEELTKNKKNFSHTSTHKNAIDQQTRAKMFTPM